MTLDRRPDHRLRRPAAQGTINAETHAASPRATWAEIAAPAGIFLLALAVRALYLAQISVFPFYNHPVVDGAGYWEWAGRIAAGDFWGTGVFYQAPLYPYFLALVRAVFGANLTVVYAVQSALGASACVFIYYAGARLFSRGAGVAAAMMMALYPPLLFADGIVQKESLAVFLMSALLLLAVRAETGARRWTWFAIGICAGLLALTRENLLALVPVLLVWPLVRACPAGRRDRFLSVGAVLIGLLLTLAPVAVRNLTVGGEFVITTSQMGPNLYIGNHAGADGRYAPLKPNRAAPEFERADATDLAQRACGRALSPGEVSAYWTGRALAFVREHPGDWLRLMLRKALLFANAYEIPDDVDLYYTMEWSTLLRVMGSVWHFGILLPLAAAGVALTWPLRRQLGLFYLMGAIIPASVVLFYVFGRYRLPMAPLLMLFAGGALTAWWRAHMTRAWRPALLGAVIVIAVGLVANLPLVDPRSDVAMTQCNLGSLLTAQGRPDMAADCYRRAIEAAPRLPTAHYGLGVALWQTGDRTAAIAAYREAALLAPDFLEAWNNLGVALMLTGQREEAAKALARALTLAPDDATVRRNIGRLNQ